MASKGLIMINSTASTLVPNRVISSNPSLVGLGSFNVVSSSSLSLRRPCSSSSSSSRGLALVVRSQQHDQPESGVLIHAPAPIGTTDAVHSSYAIKEDEHEMKLVLDMPGVPADDIDVKVEGDMLVIKDMGRQLYSPYDTTFQLPPYVEKLDVSATLINGVLHVSIPKKAVLVPFKPTPLVEETVQGVDSSIGTSNITLPAIELEEWQNRTALLDFPNYVRMPWGHIEDDKIVKVSMDVPGLLANEIMVNIMGDLLVVDGGLLENMIQAGKLDDLGRIIPGFHAKLKLPKGCIKDQAYAVLKSGILYINVPKLPALDTIIPVDVPVRSG